MPIRIPDALPAAAQLESENIFVMTEYRALHQDIRPLRVLILNLMPTKIATETQIMRKLSNTPLQVEVDLLRTKTHEATHVSAGHLETFYRTFDDIRDIHYDGLIITGAPVEQMLRTYPQIRQVYLCLDNDVAGHSASERMESYLRAEDISAMRLVPVRKDWNEDLCVE